MYQHLKLSFILTIFSFRKDLKFFQNQTRKTSDPSKLFLFWHLPVRYVFYSQDLKEMTNFSKTNWHIHESEILKLSVTSSHFQIASMLWWWGDSRGNPFLRNIDPWKTALISSCLPKCERNEFESPNHQVIFGGSMIPKTSLSFP